MKITFIYPDIIMHRLDWTGYFYEGLASLSAALKQEGHETSLIHITQPIGKSDLIDRVRREDPGLIGFSATSHMFPYVKEYASWLFEAGADVPTICGGIHPTIAPDEVLQTNGIDMLCRGEGEAPIAELCQRMENHQDITAIPNLWVKREDRILKNPLRPLLQELDSLPFPDRSIFDCQSLYGARNGRGSFLASRGCPYSCTYCCNHLLRGIYGTDGKPIRYRSVDNAIEEIKDALERYPFIETLQFDDDILFLNKKWSEEFSEKYSREINLPFICNARANITDRERVGLLKKAGCYHVKFGLESGDQTILNEVLNRNMTIDDIEKSFALCKEAGIITESLNMVGVPYETPSRVLNTIKLNASINVDKMHVSIYQPYQGTSLGKLCAREGFLVSNDLEPDLYSQSVLRLNTISQSQVLMFRDYFKALVRYYQFLLRLPGRTSGFLTRISDRVLSHDMTAVILDKIYIPLNFVFRRMQLQIGRIKMARHKIKTPMLPLKSTMPH